jgi:hypothetical protein
MCCLADGKRKFAAQSHAARVRRRDQREVALRGFALLDKVGFGLAPAHRGRTEGLFLGHRGRWPVFPEKPGAIEAATRS